MTANKTEPKIENNVSQYICHNFNEKFHIGRFSTRFITFAHLWFCSLQARYIRTSYERFEKQMLLTIMERRNSSNREEQTERDKQERTEREG